MAENVVFRRGTLEEYNALLEKDPNALYFLTDKLQFRMGDKTYGVGEAASLGESGLMSAEDKAELDKIVKSGIAGLAPVNGSITIGDGEDGTKTIGVQLSQKEHNAIKVEDDGLYSAEGAEYELEQAEDAGTYEAVYKLKKTVNGEVTYTGTEIKIPKDKVIKSGKLEIVETPDNPYSGAEAGDPYIDITLDNDDATHIYIPVKGLVDVVEAGDGIEVARGNVVSVKPVFEKVKYEALGLLEGARFDVYGRELRVMFPSNAPFERPSGDVPGRDKDCYYVGIRFFAPGTDVTGFKEGEDKVDPGTKMEDFNGTSSGVDKYGRKYDVCWFPVARCDPEGDTWTYMGDQSSAGNCVGWYHTIEWYVGETCVDSETVRINLTNPDCHNSLMESLGRSNRPEGVILWDEI